MVKINNSNGTLSNLTEREHLMLVEAWLAAKCQFKGFSDEEYEEYYDTCFAIAGDIACGHEYGDELNKLIQDREQEMDREFEDACYCESSDVWYNR